MFNKIPDYCLGCNLMGIRERIKKLIVKYEHILKDGDYSIVDGEEEVKDIIKDLKELNK